MPWGVPIPISRKQNKEESFHRKFISRPSVCSSAIFDPLTLLIRTFSVIKWKEKKQVIFLYISFVVFLCYAILLWHNIIYFIFFLFPNSIWSFFILVAFLPPQSNWNILLLIYFQLIYLICIFYNVNFFKLQ